MFRLIPKISINPKRQTFTKDNGRPRAAALACFSNFQNGYWNRVTRYIRFMFFLSTGALHVYCYVCYKLAYIPCILPMTQNRDIVENWNTQTRQKSYCVFFHSGIIHRFIIKWWVAVQVFWVFFQKRFFLNLLTF